MISPSLSAEAFSNYLNNPTDEDAVFAVDAYSHLGGFCFQAFTTDNPRLQTGGVRHGFNVIGRLIRHAVKLYPNHVADQNATPEVDELREILLNSHTTPTRFAKMSNNRNSVVEVYFGLKSDVPVSFISDLYCFESNTPCGTLFMANNEAFSKALQVADIEAPLTAHTLTDKCPMLEVTQEIIWPAMVNLAADAPEAFAHDLAIEK